MNSDARLRALPNAARHGEDREKKIVTSAQSLPWATHLRPRRRDRARTATIIRSHASVVRAIVPRVARRCRVEAARWHLHADDGAPRVTVRTLLESL